MDGSPSFSGLLVFSGVLAGLPIFLLMGTSYAKISIVLFLVRNALGIQQTPPGSLLNAIAVVLTLYIMAPVFQDVYAAVRKPGQTYQTFDDYERVIRNGAEPVRHFLDTHARPEARAFFLESTSKVWRDSKIGPVADTDFTILLPAFLVSELTRAFEIGFLLYLPFLVVDFVVSVILVAMGMQVLSPTVISTPLKLLLFIAIDGWSRLLQGLVLSYAPPGP